MCGVNVGGLVCGTSINSTDSTDSIDSIDFIDSIGSIDAILGPHKRSPTFTPHTKGKTTIPMERGRSARTIGTVVGAREARAPFVYVVCGVCGWCVVWMLAVFCVARVCACLALGQKKHR